MQSEDVNRPVQVDLEQSLARSNRRNKISGAIAIALGAVVLVFLMIENRWDAHDTVKPIKALLGAVLFIAAGFWYYVKGAKAESWSTKAILAPASGSASCAPKRSHPRGRFSANFLIDEEMLKNPEFQKQCQALETKLREVAKSMEEKGMQNSQASNQAVNRDAAP